MFTRKKKPTVFVGSSVESLQVLEAVVELLGSYAQVTPWTDNARFSQIGDYFLDSLIRAAAEFDFAVLVFGPDDTVHSRQSVQKVPRDNVVFELGLFLSQLGRRRTFVIAPTVWRTDLKILTDLQGFRIAEYDPDDRLDYKTRLRPSCRDIGRRIQELQARQPRRGPRGITDMGRPLDEYLRTARALGASVTVRNIALDMEVTWPLVRDMLLHPEDTEEITWQSLMIDGRADAVKGLSSGTVSPRLALDIEAKIQGYMSANSTELRGRRVKFECKAYSSVPVLHGFLVDSTLLFFSLCGIKQGRLMGSPNPYIRLESRAKPMEDEATSHFIRVFEGWFDYNWSIGRPIWPK